MTDEGLRALERRWSETGAVADEAAYLGACVRTGSLTREQLDLAAYCGHEAALLAGGAPAPEVADELLALLADDGRRQLEVRFHHGLRWWALGLRRFGPAAWANAIAAALTLQVEARPGVTPDDLAFVRELDVGLVEWGACPCAAHLESLRARLETRPVNDLDRHLGLDAVHALEAPLEPARFGPFEPLARARSIGRAVAIAGGLARLIEADGAWAVLLHDCGPRGLPAAGVLASAMGVPLDFRRPHLRSPGLPFSDAARRTSVDAVRGAVCRRSIALVLGRA